MTTPEVRRPEVDAATGSGSSGTPLLPMVALVLLAVVPPLGYLTASLYTPDETMLVTYPLEVMDGRVPNVDFYTVYGTPMYRALGVVYDVFGATPTAERLVGLGYHVAIALGMYAMTRRFGRGPAWAAAAISCVFLGTLYLAAFAWLGGLALLIWSLALVHAQHSTWRWVTAGLLGGLAAGWRYEFAAVALVAALPWLLRHRRAPWVIAGALVGCIPTAVHVIPAFSEVYDNVFAGRVAGNFQSDLSTVGIGTLVGTALLVAVAVALLAAAIRLRDRWLWSVALASIAMLPQALQRIDDFHFAFVGCFVFPVAVAPLLATSHVRALRGYLSPPVRTVAACALAALLTLEAAGAVARFTDLAPTVSNDGRSLRLPSEAAAATRATIAEVEQKVPRGANIFMGAEDMSVPSTGFFPLYYLLGRDYRFDQYYLELAAGVAERNGSGLDQDIERADALVLWDLPGAPMSELFPNLPTGDQESNDAVRDHFCRESQHGNLVLYLRCG